MNREIQIENVIPQKAIDEDLAMARTAAFEALPTASP
jgi:hypothetical protein